MIELMTARRRKSADLNRTPSRRWNLSWMDGDPRETSKLRNRTRVDDENDEALNDFWISLYYCHVSLQRGRSNINVTSFLFRSLPYKRNENSFSRRLVTTIFYGDTNSKLLISINWMLYEMSTESITDSIHISDLKFFTTYTVEIKPTTFLKCIFLTHKWHR